MLVQLASVAWSVTNTCVADLQEGRNEIINNTLEEYAQIAVWTINRDRNNRIVSVTFPEEDIARA